MRRPGATKGSEATLSFVGSPHNDLSNVVYISSVGLRVLMVAAKALRTRKASIAIASLQPIVAEIVEISRFHHVVDVRRDVREALGAISAPALAAYDRTGATGRT